MLEEGRAALERRAWAAAREALAAARDATGLEPADLERLALASYLVGDATGFVDALEHAHRAYVAADEHRTAARCAFWIGFHLANSGEPALASGWFGRAGRLVERVGADCAERGYILLPGGQRQLGAGDYDACARTALEAEALAQRFRDDDLLTLALHLRGRARLRQGRVGEGLPLLDEAMVAVVSDELTPQVAGTVYCSVISACREVWAIGRTREYTGALSAWCDAQPDLVAYSGECRIFRAEILQHHGAWREAIQEARRALDRLGRHAEPGAEGAALYQQGEAHRLLGELGAAEEAFRAASLRGREPQPGLALLRLDQGDPHAARAALERSLAETTGHHRRARLLPAYVTVLLESGDLDAAREACDELAEIAEVWNAELLRTTVDQLRGAVSLAGGDARAALPVLRRAWEAWQALDVPYEAARTRALLGLACRALDDEEGADLALGAARAELERLGAVREIARLDAAAGRRRARDEHGLTPRELEVLAALATGGTNRAIAEALFISEKTVARHVANIYAKLGLSSRSAATAYAYRHGLQEAPDRAHRTGHGDAPTPSSSSDGE